MDNNSGKKITPIELIVGIVSAIIVISFLIFVLFPALTGGTEKKQKQEAGNKVYNFVQQPADSSQQSAEAAGEISEAETGLDMQMIEAAAASAQESPMSGDYIFADSSQRNLTEDDLKYLSDEELWIARNEIYARLGRRFTNETLQAYFGSKPWYQGSVDPDAFSDDRLNAYEKANTRFIKSYEERRKNGEVAQEPRPADSADFREHEYRVVMEDSTWNQAYQRAVSEGGHLVNFDSAEEYQYVLDHVIGSSYPKGKFWIGGKRDADSEDYHWVGSHGEVGSRVLNRDEEFREFWMKGEPSYYDSSVNQDEYWMNMFFYKNENRWVWNDVPDDIISLVPTYKGTVGYIIEFE